ncbi:ileal sodium/bile acid cotransporter-like isoform X2 [Cylas formicarius]|nr:ileal sodium/bile acid cotransporter-like isoform X2 [Cylas formicarius]XP_060528744.1 ileal sodium/bile acid cotransporter-like isoform X2 [Cylas formicarius]
MMCPISGLCQLLIIIFTLLLIGHTVVVRALSVKFDPKNVTVYMSDFIPVNYTIDTGGELDNEDECILYSENPHIAFIDKEIILSTLSPPRGTFNISGNFLGQTVVSCRNINTGISSSEQVAVKCLRKKRIIDQIFTASTAALVAIIYINFGCVVKWNELKNLLKKPIGPTIGFCGQFVIMPVLSYVIGFLLFPDDPEMRLGMFFTGVSPAGGASNIWTAILEGNIELSILMTTISTIAAFGMMPLWIFTLGRTIFEQADLEVPYSQISTYVFALVIPLGIGYLITRYLNRVGQFMARILKGFSSLLILFIIIFAIVTNLYLFELFSWRIVVAGMGLPWVGYMLGYVMAKILRQPAPDCLAIAIETGIQNTGIAIFLLRFALEPLHADLTTVAPVSVAIMTPFPLMLVFIYKKLRERFYPYKKSETMQDLCERRKQDNNNLNHIVHKRQNSTSPCLD